MPTSVLPGQHHVQCEIARQWYSSLGLIGPFDRYRQHSREMPHVVHGDSPIQDAECAEMVLGVNAKESDGGQSCKCNKVGSHNQYCSAMGGQCECKLNIVGRACDRCKLGSFNFGRDRLGCTPCKCNVDGTEENTFCNPQNGQWAQSKYQTSWIRRNVYFF